MVEQAERLLGVKHTIILPTRQNPLKTTAPISGEHRAELCRLAFGAAHRTIDTTELQSAEGAAYTIDTVRRILAQRSPIAPAPWLLIGADAAAQLPQWRDTEELQRLVRLAVALRPGTAPVALAVPTKWIPTAVDISSTQVRASLATASPQVEQWLPPAVTAWIKEQRLYGPIGS